MNKRTTYTPTVQFKYTQKISQESANNTIYNYDNGSVLLNGTSYLEAMFGKWQDSPASVSLEWQAYFKAALSNPIVSSARTKPMVSNVQLTGDNIANIKDHLKVALLIRAYQVRGHLRGDLDPLGISHTERDWSPAPELDLSYYGFTERDLGIRFQLGHMADGSDGLLQNLFSEPNSTATLAEIFEALKEIYSGTTGYEYMHIPDRNQCEWIRSRIEKLKKASDYDATGKKQILERLMQAELFEQFIGSKFPSEKRFGLEGGESIIPGLLALMDRAAENSVSDIVFGMSHRGRLNVLGNVLGQPFEAILGPFVPSKSHQQTDEKGQSNGGGAPFSDDVKYHLGYEGRKSLNGHSISVALLANPSHLEAVCPVVEGKVRAMQHQRNNDASCILPVLIHGDAAFAGQGVVYETLGLANLDFYSTSGTIHVIINNQIGFTTDPRAGRSTPYCSDVAKWIDAPILHVNGDDVEAVVDAFRFAVDWRQQFKKDVVVDVVCYRRHGHNEVDQPSFTQPRMYQAIQSRMTTCSIFKEKLLKDKTITPEYTEQLETRFKAGMEAALAQARSPANSVDETSASRKNLPKPSTAAKTTGISKETFESVSGALCSIPDGFALHPVLVKIVKARKDALLSTDKDQAVLDMATAEALAFGSLLLEEKSVRLSGQDVERGTFSQRHAVWHDQKQASIKHVPLQQLTMKTNNDDSHVSFTVCNSSLSEFGVLGFELGYSLVNPDTLVAWEAQFGDFANNAQAIIDQFLVSGERKWRQRTSLVMLLPHGYDGAGPEHSNARLSRFLELCDDDPRRRCPGDQDHPQAQDGEEQLLGECNMQVVCPSTPASYFHVLRRQLHGGYRKPLILFTSKSLLRHPSAKSPIKDVLGKSSFRTVIPDDQPNIDKAKVERVVLCSGQHYYALKAAREANNLSTAAIVRVEQLHPLPLKAILHEIASYPTAKTVVWAQEEPLNMGSWQHVSARLNHNLPPLNNITEASPKKAKKMNETEGARRNLIYAGRPPTAAVATGVKAQHVQEVFDAIHDALFDVEQRCNGQRLPIVEVVRGVPIFKTKK